MRRAAARAEAWVSTFLALLLAQTVSLVGSQMAGFALGVWLYQRTGATAVYGFVALANVGPIVLFGPFAGVLIDRWDRRRVLLMAHVGGGACSLLLALLYRLEAISLSTVLLPLVVASCFGALQFPAVSAATATLVAPAQLGRANGLLQLSFAVGQLAAPVTAGAMLSRVGVGWILLVDVGSFLFAVGVLVFLRIPRPPARTPERERGVALWQEMAAGWAFLRSHPGLMALLVLFAAVNFVFGIVQVVFTPVVLRFADSRVLGAIISLGGVGMVTGSMVMAVWGGPRLRIHGVLGFTFLQGLLMLLLAAAPPSVVLFGVGSFGVLFAMPLIGGSSEAIWQRKVPPDLHGRVFSLRATVAGASLALAYAMAGPLTDRVFEPLMAETGPLAPTVGRLLGTGHGRGAALLLVVLATLMLTAVAVGFLYPRLRRVELDLPDHPARGNGFSTRAPRRS
jgi:DHA3 family macrolide efflux protein-like MFS transporter